MKKSLCALGCLAMLALPLSMTAPAHAQDETSPPAKTEMAGRQPRGGPDGMMGGCGCPMMMEHGMKGPGMEGKGMMGQGMMGQGMMGQGMEDKGMMMSDMMKPAGKETPEMVQLRQDIQAQHEKLMADKTQMRADCQRMHELFLRMKQLRTRHHEGPKSPTNKGNAAPANPATNGKAGPATP